MVKAMKTLNQKGFSLIEVLVAFTLFALFITAFLTGQGYNVTDSELSREQLILQSLAERKINELILDPPKFTNADNNKKETRTFEETEWQTYEYTLELKKLVIPDFGQLFGQKDGVGQEGQDAYEGNYFDDGNKSQRNSNLEKKIFEELKKNIERIIWQARVTVTNKETKYSYTLSTYLTNYNEKIQLNVGM